MQMDADRRNGARRARHNRASPKKPSPKTALNTYRKTLCRKSQNTHSSPTLVSPILVGASPIVSPRPAHRVDELQDEGRDGRVAEPQVPEERKHRAEQQQDIGELHLRPAEEVLAEKTHGPQSLAPEEHRLGVDTDPWELHRTATADAVDSLRPGVGGVRSRVAGRRRERGHARRRPSAAGDEGAAGDECVPTTRQVEDLRARFGPPGMLPGPNPGRIRDVGEYRSNCPVAFGIRNN
jgi:hypothetical protein